MVITSYDQLTPTEKIVYSRYIAGSLTDEQLASLVSKGKVRQDAADFMILIKNS